jgi:hypothetical protein
MAKAQKALTHLEAEAVKGEAARNAAIDSKASVWQELKPELEKLSHKKCWFSEALETVSHMHVEHFRPKKRVVEIGDRTQGREGYWWLAFEWTNFRVAGQIPNCKKGNYFPLRAGSNVATSTRRAIADEQHLFLDPTKHNDVRLVTFGPDGLMHPKPRANTWENTRVEKTAEYFGLNDFPNLTDARRKVWQECQTLLDAMAENLNASEKCGGSPANLATAEAKMQELRKRIAVDAPFSNVAMACIKGFDSELLTALI